MISKGSAFESVVRSHNNAVAFNFNDLLIPNYVQGIEGPGILQHVIPEVVGAETQVDAVLETQLLKITKDPVEIDIHLIEDAGRPHNFPLHYNLTEKFQSDQ